MTSRFVAATVTDEPNFKLCCFAYDEETIATAELFSSAVNHRPEVTSDAVRGPTLFVATWTPATENELKLIGGGVLELDPDELEAPNPNDPKVPEMFLSSRRRPPEAAFTPFSFSISATFEEEKVADPALALRTSRANGVPAAGAVPEPPRLKRCGPPEPAAAVCVTLMSVPTP